MVRRKHRHSLKGIGKLMSGQGPGKSMVRRLGTRWSVKEACGWACRGGTV